MLVGMRASGQGVPAINSAAELGQELLVKSGSTGLVLVVVRGKETFVQGFGETAPGSGVVPDRSSVVRLCSLTKIFATDLLVKMMGDGTVRLDDPLQKFAPKGVRVPVVDEARPMTLGDLATHTAGLPREVGPTPRGTAHFTFPSESFRRGWLPRQRLKAVPGSAALYSNVGFDLLGDALSAAAHESYPRLLARRTTGPLGMRETGYGPTAAQCARLLGGSHPEGECTPTANTAGSSGLYSTGSDMQRWLEYLLGDGYAGDSGTECGGAGGVCEAGTTAACTRVGSCRRAGWSRVGMDPYGGAGGCEWGEPVWGYRGEDGGWGGVSDVYRAEPGGRIRRSLWRLRMGGWRTHLNLFRAANNVLLRLAGLPEFPEELPHPRAVVVMARITAKVRGKGKAIRSRGAARSAHKKR